MCLEKQANEIDAQIHNSCTSGCLLIGLTNQYGADLYTSAD